MVASTVLELLPEKPSSIVFGDSSFVTAGGRCVLRLYVQHICQRCMTFCGICPDSMRSGVGVPIVGNRLALPGRRISTKEHATWQELVVSFCQSARHVRTVLSAELNKYMYTPKHAQITKKSFSLAHPLDLSKRFKPFRSLAISHPRSTLHSTSSLESSLLKMLFAPAVFMSGLVAVTSAHFQLQYPTPRGVFVEDNEVTFCGMS